MDKKLKSNRSDRKQRKKRILLEKLKIITGTIIFLIFLSGLIFVSLFIADTPKLDVAKLQYTQSSTIYDMNDKAILDLAGEEYRKSVSIEEIPENIQNAVIATEDIRFYNHHGIDIKRVVRVIISNIQDGFGVEGASTITQQTVKNAFLSSEKTMKRKVQEAYLSLQLERKYSKEEILEMYLNKIYFGQGAYGVAAASEVYFNKPLEEVTLEEAALLTGLIQRPSEYDPFVNPDKAENRRNLVLSLMKKNKMINEEEEKKAKSIAVEDTLHKEKKEPKYEAFVEQVIKEVVKTGEVSEAEIYTEGLKIYTTLDKDAQDYMDYVLATNELIEYPDEKFRAGTALLDTKTGAIRALGGRKREDQEGVARGFNYATQIKRSPGSTIKPILDYGPAIEHLNWPTARVIRDEQLVINGKDIKNWNDEYHGLVTMRMALQWSYNVPAVKTYLEVGPERSKKFAEGLGIHLNEILPSYAIGGFTHGVSPLEMAGAYTAFGNSGTHHESFSVRKIVFPDGKIIEISPKKTKAMHDYTAYMITDMLKTVVNSGTGMRANIPEIPMAGKTGTTNLPEEIDKEGTSDSWFVGYTTQYTMAVWTGYDQTTKETYLTKQDSRIAQYIFKEVMTHVSQNSDVPDFERPDSVVEKRVAGRTELFVKGTENQTFPILQNKPEKKKKKDKVKEVQPILEPVEEEVEEEVEETTPNQDSNENSTPAENQTEEQNGEVPNENNEPGNIPVEDNTNDVPSSPSLPGDEGKTGWLRKLKVIKLTELL